MTKAAPNPNTPAPVELTDASITEALRAAGMIETPQEFPRIKVDGQTFIAGDNMYISNPKSGDPAFLAQLLGPPIEYQARWFDDDGDLAQAIARPELAGTMCKSHFAKEGEKREFNEKGMSCRTCQVNPWVHRDNLPPEARGQKCTWRGDIELRILADDMTIADETVWTLSLSTTGMIEFKGTGKEPAKGSVSDFNFMHRLARFGGDRDPENPNRGALHAITSLPLGLVVAEVRSIPAQASNGNRYSVVSFNPAAIVEADDQPALTTTEQPDESPVPF